MNLVNVYCKRHYVLYIEFKNRTDVKIIVVLVADGLGKGLQYMRHLDHVGPYRTASTCLDEF